MDGWAIDSYGLRAAYSQTVLDQLRDTDRLPRLTVHLASR
jgi:hypothetical protein